MDQKQQIAEKIKQANNILVTVSNNPSVDQLASCIGLTLAFNKMGKHATAVFSGEVPSTIEFLQPDKTLEDNVDSLRDFIISLDKSKADKLRYKVEDKVVKIFITPYRTSISDKDLEFGQGDFNVDMVIALGVHQQSDLDQAIASQGGILHDATVVTMNVQPGGELGSINWLVPGASSLCELAVDLVNAVDKELFDSQIATALLTGIVAETERFSNQKTSPDTMSLSAQLMAAGADQQLVATKLEEPEPEPEPEPQPEPPKAETPEQVDASKPEDQPAEAPAEPPKTDDGTLEITHHEQPEQEEVQLPAPAQDNADKDEDKPVASLEDLTKDDKPEEPQLERIHIDDQGSLHKLADIEKQDAGGSTDPTQHMGGGRMVLQPPSSSPESAPGDLLAPPQPDAQEGERPSGAPPAGPMPFTSPASATIAPPATPFASPSMTPSTDSPTPPSAPPVPDLIASNISSVAPGADAAHTDPAPGAVNDIFTSSSNPSAPPDLTSGAPASSQPSGLNLPTPAGPPPPTPPPMLPPIPQP